jgi:hypothetical protein
MPARRPLAAAAAVAALLLTLSGCQKPTPGVTLVSGGDSVHTESATFCRDGQSATKQNCVVHKDQIGVIRVRQGDPVGIDVDRTLSKHGWLLYDADQKARSEIQNTHYFAYTPDFTNRPLKSVINLEVWSTDHVAQDAGVTGVWRFQLIQK